VPDGAAGPSFGPNTDMTVSALCGGQLLRSGENGLTASIYSGDTAFHVDDWSVDEFDPLTGDATPLFSIDNHDDGLIRDYVVDDQDFYAITEFELYRFDRVNHKLALVSRAPDSPVETTFLGITAFAPNLALSSTQVLTQPYDTEGTSSGGAQFRPYVGLFERATGELELLPVSRADAMEFAGDQIYFFDSVTEQLSPGVTQSHGELDFYDPKTDSASLLASSFNDYTFVGSTLWYTLQNAGDAFHYDLYRVSAAGATPDLVQSDLANDDLVAHGTKLYLMRDDPPATSPVLTEFDTSDGTSREIGNCGRAVSVGHVSDTAIYLDQATAPGGTYTLTHFRIPL
jgi:hypothetical protein